MPEPATPAAPAEPVADPNNEPAAPTDDPNSGGTTPEEVAAVLKGSGINLPDTKPAVADPVATDDEEGDDPDAVTPPAAPATDDESADDDEAKPAKPAEPAVAATDDDKYSFQIEDNNGVTFKISVGAKMEDILSEFEPKNNGQIVDIVKELVKLETQKETDEAKVAEDATAEERRTAASELLSGWQEEATALQGDKRIPEGADGDKRINDVYKYMADENDARMKAGKPTINSFEDALDKLENKEARDKAVADAKADKETARANGAKVGGNSAPASSGPPVYRAGSAKNANQAINSLGLLK